MIMHSYDNVINKEITTGTGTGPTKGAPPKLTLFFPCNAHRVNVKITHSRGHGAPLPPVPLSVETALGPFLAVRYGMGIIIALLSVRLCWCVTKPDEKSIL